MREARAEPTTADPKPTRSGRERKLSQKAAEWKDSGDKTASKLKTVLLCVGSDGDKVVECGLNLTVEESMRQDPNGTTKAVLSEVLQMVDFDVMEGVLPKKISHEVRKRRLPSKVVMKVKKEKGIKVRTKASLVGGVIAS